MLDVYADNFLTGFPQKMWKTLKSPMVINVCLIMLSIAILSSCSYLKGTKKQNKVAQSASAAEASKQADQKVPEAPQAAPEKKAPAPQKELPKAKLVPDTGVIDMTEAEVKRKYGEPDIVSKRLITVFFGLTSQHGSCSLTTKAQYTLSLRMAKWLKLYGQGEL